MIDGGNTCASSLLPCQHYQIPVHGFCFKLFSSTFNLGPDFLGLAMWISVGGFESKDTDIVLRKWVLEVATKGKWSALDLLRFKHKCVQK